MAVGEPVRGMSGQWVNESLREVWQVVEYRDGAVYRTERLREEWVPFGHPHQVGDLIYAAPSTARVRALLAEGKNTVRMRRA